MSRRYKVRVAWPLLSQTPMEMVLVKPPFFAVTRQLVSICIDATVPPTGFGLPDCLNADEHLCIGHSVASTFGRTLQRHQSKQRLATSVAYRRPARGAVVGLSRENLYAAASISFREDACADWCSL